MAKLIERPTGIDDAGNLPKRIEECVGRVNTRTEGASNARTQCAAAGWVEPGQAPEFDEHSVVLDSMLRMETKSGVLEVRAGQAVHTPAREWVRYSTPQGAEYCPRSCRTLCTATPELPGQAGVGC